jgi:AraC family transcriptional regulator
VQVGLHPLPGIEACDDLLDTIDTLTRTLLVEPDGQADCALLLSRLLRQVDETCAVSPGPRPWDEGTPNDEELDRRLARCIEWMRQNLASRDPIEAVVSRFGLSRPHGFYLFQRRFAMGPAAYSNVLRMEHAIGKLQAKGTPIGHIAADLGFESQGNFTRFFRGIQGVAPGDYQAAARRQRRA